jgi:hypothetical protein
MTGLLHLEGLVTREAIARLKPEMHLAMQGYDLFTPPMTLIRNGPGGTHSCIHLCENLVQFGLPCWRIMQSHLRQNHNAPLPSDFVHPRWFIGHSPQAEAAGVNSTSNTITAPPAHYLPGSGEMLLTKTAVDVGGCTRARGRGEDLYSVQYQKAPVSVGRISTVDLHHSNQGSIM